MKKGMIFIAIAALACGSGALGYSIQKSTSDLSALTIANIEALTEIVDINGQNYIVDIIPCASAGEEIRVDCSYVNCSTCKIQYGKSDGLEGTCTEVRPF